MQQGDQLDPPVRDLLELEHQHRRPAGVRARYDVQSIHTDWSVGMLPDVARTETPSPGRSARRRDGSRLDRRTRAARAQRQEAREELLAAALRVFAKRGYQQAGVDEIAAEAGYSKGALYW